MKLILHQGNYMYALVAQSKAMLNNDACQIYHWMILWIKRKLSIFYFESDYTMILKKVEGYFYFSSNHLAPLKEMLFRYWDVREDEICFWNFFTDYLKRIYCLPAALICLSVFTRISINSFLSNRLWGINGNKIVRQVTFVVARRKAFNDALVRTL